MRYILAITFLFLAGCATRSTPMEPSVYLLSTKNDPKWLLDQVAEELKKNRYEVESVDYNVGLLVMAPRRFVIVRRDGRAYGEQVFQIRQEGGSVKVRISYSCEYPKGTTDCDTKDQEAVDKIRRLERLLLSMINRKLFKKTGVVRSKSKEI